MAKLPDPTASLADDDRAALERNAAVRARASGRATRPDVYVRMFNNPGVARAVGQLGEHLRFHGTLPDRARELAILRFAARRRVGYEWVHHLGVAQRAGLSQTTIAELIDPGAPHGLSDPDRAVVEAVDATLDHRSLPQDLQDRLVASFGLAGVVEVVVLCGLYCLMEDMVTAFDIEAEDDLPTPPF